MHSKASIRAGRSDLNYNRYVATRPVILGLGKGLFLGLCQLSYVTAAPIIAVLKKDDYDHENPDGADASLWLYLAVAAALVLLGGAFAGLTIALMGQDGVYLQVIATSGEGKEQRHAQKVYKLLQRGKHWVLVTLLLSNVIVNETLPIVLDRSLGGGWPAVLGSTVLIVIFGEVIPQSICVRYGLSIGAYMAPSVLGLMWLLAPIAWPTAKLLDTLLGEDHGTVYKKSGLKTLVTLHKTLGHSPTDRLNEDEVTIISAVLDLKDKAIGDIMTPMDDVFTMSADTILDEDTMNVILSAGYSRIPIYDPGNKLNFVGMLLVKILITYDPEDCKKVSEFALATLPETRPETSCLDIVNFFQEGKSHMVLVSEFPGKNYGATGVVTLEDVIEELIGEEIIDESDVYIDVHKAIRRLAPAPKARVQKGHTVGNLDNQVVHISEDHLVDLSEAQGEAPAAELIKCHSNGQARSDSPAAVFGTSPKTTFMRRGSSGVEGPILVRGNVHDMREHLKHLGPSNLASRPKTTRYQTVKIKPGNLPATSSSRTESTGYRDSIIQSPYKDNPASQGGEGEGLLKSGGMDAKDGVHALQQGYGSMDYTSPQSPKLVKYETMDGASLERPASRTSRNSPSPRRDGLNGLPTDYSDRSSDTLGSLRLKSPTGRKRRSARSGSITENIIEAGGFQKVVLQTNSSSDREDSGSSRDRKKNENISFEPSPTSNLTRIDDQTKERTLMPKGEDVKKKRRRNRKKKGGKVEEESSTASAFNE